jgi:hypothetical protein
MNEEEVIRLFIKNGYQLSKTALPLVLSNPEQIISELAKIKPRPLFVTEKHIKGLSLKKTEIKPKILKEYEITKKEIRIEDYVNFLHVSYEKIKPMLLKKMDKEKIISINKISSKSNIFSLIGIVREKGDNNIILEDPSGEICILFDDELRENFVELGLDDVIGINCKKVKEKIYARKLYYPDVASSREINKTMEEMKIAVLSSISSLKNEKLISFLSQTPNLLVVFVFMEKDEQPTSKFSNFNIIKIHKNSSPKLIQIENIKTLLLPAEFSGFGRYSTNTIDFIVSVLKRRHLTLDPTSNISDNDFVLDEVPDIIISDLKESSYKNYKGTTIVSNSDSSKVFLIDLKNREIEEKIFSDW